MIYLIKRCVNAQGSVNKMITCDCYEKNKDKIMDIMENMRKTQIIEERVCWKCKIKLFFKKIKKIIKKVIK